MMDESLDELLQGFPLLPVPVTLQEKLEALIRNHELYQEDAGPGSSGKPAEER